SLSRSFWILVTESALLPLVQKEHLINTQHSFCHSPQLSWGFSSVIINDLLDISRIESGIGFTLHKVSCNINEIIRERVKYFQASYPKRQFDIILPQEPVEVKVDKDKIGQVLENILSNAVKYSPEGGEIRLSTERIADCGFRNAELEEREKESTLRTPQSAIEISVADHGMGMSPEQVGQIFDKFYRADAFDAAISGTGLGMNIVKNYVEAHGGKVWVESELGKGTVVKFLLKI
ncbi:MAG: HAMP domain-containing sensor histidine kinase, partial [Thermodesulfobacteriota bacterium]|nr:HAMP domain-containing sensor histidine kinase [Thermodesulfobacteriota bacterium]